MAVVLTPQDFSTCFLVFGPVIIHPRKYYTPCLTKVKDIFVLKETTNDAKVTVRHDYVRNVAYADWGFSAESNLAIYYESGFFFNSLLMVE